MGAGKSTAARDCAALRGGRAIDTDKLIEERLQESIEEIFERRGEREFRELEEQVVCEALAQAGPPDCVALGGGAVLSARVRAALEPHTTVLLDIGVDVAWQRVWGRGRPLAHDRPQFEALHAERRELYEQLADAVLPAQMRRGLLARADPALRALEAAPQGSRLLWAVSASGEYPVLAGNGVIGAWPLAPVRRFAVSDETVAPLYLERVAAVEGEVTIPPGEGSKTLAQAEQVLRSLARSGMARDDCLLALGGGVVGDLAGFCAATYQRGVPIVHVPTSLVAQVDSAYGGKTGVDLPEAKNYVGAYHQPAAVIADVDALATLPAPELAAGYAEVLKTALIAGGELWRRVAAEEPLDAALVLDCARTKLAIVERDERDAGVRQVLNLGHTVGHAIEAATGYRRYRHGEAVGLGLLASLTLSGRPELRAQVAALLAAHGLPLTMDADVEAVLAATARDKKRLAGRVGFVLLEAPGEVHHGCPVPERELRLAVQQLAAK
ncbi:MAG: hypothetical protein NVSMB51_21160 [Solirubrobacteraceae bacterium]